jgi:hypothetical protein
MLTPVILTWEYPPRVVGDLSHYVESLAAGLNEASLPVRVVTCHDSDYLHEIKTGLLEIFWASNPVKTHISVLTWCLSFNSEMERIVSDLVYDQPEVEYILDVQDWHFVPAATSLKKAHGLPFILTIHSLEEQRSPGSSYALSSCIRGLERMGLLESDLVIVKTDQTRKLIVDIYHVPEERVVVIPIEDPDWVSKVGDCYRLIARRRDVKKNA